MLWAPDDWGMRTAQIHTHTTHTAMRGQRAAHTPKSIASSFEFLFFCKDPLPISCSLLFLFFFLSLPFSLFLSLSVYTFSRCLFFPNRHKRSHAVLLVWVEKGGLTPRKEEGWGDFWRQESRPQLMENRCGRGKERKREKEEERGEERKKGVKGEGSARMDAPSSKAERQWIWALCVIVCPYIQCLRLTVCVWVAVETLTGRSAAEVWVAQ